MTEPLSHDDGSSITLARSHDRLSVSVRGPEAPSSPPIYLALAEVEALQKALGKFAAQLRVEAARPNG